MILVTGGAGYIGSHVVKKLVEKDYPLAVIDDLSTGHKAALPPGIPFYPIDLLEEKALNHTIEKLLPEAIIHFAAKSIVSASMKDPLGTFYPNLVGTMNLLKAMQKLGTRTIVFSSTAAVYGEPEKVPIEESHPLQPTNPYGESKLFIEKILSNTASAGNLSYISLRYFNAAGADPGGEIGEDHDPETHLIPLVLAAAKEKKELTVYGNDYPTVDGTPVRDYIHINDLVSAHILALEALLKGEKTGAAYNLGNQRGHSVLEVIKKAEEVTGKKIARHFGPRRMGDPSVLVASSELIKKELNWKPYCSDLETIIETAWKWHQGKPGGYPK